jgi:gluconokinase
MGPTGSGKTTVGRALAARLGWRFIEGDDYHPPSNVAKMGAGQPLNDADRAPWLDRLRAEIIRTLERREDAVLTCSALKQQYRDTLSAGLRGVRFVYLQVPPGVLADRVASRTEHFAGPALVASQTSELETPSNALTVDGTTAPAAIVAEIRTEFGLR